MRKLLGIVFAISSVVPAITAEDNKPLADAGPTTCDYPDSASHTGRLVSSKAGYAAAVELRVKMSGSDIERHCVTSWILHVQDRKKQPTSITVAERDDVPEDNEWIQENSFEIKTWSESGKLALLSQIEVQGDWDETTPIVYDFEANKYWRVELQPLFKKLIPSDCYVIYRPLRFVDEATVLISVVSTDTDTDREPGTKACFKDSLWGLDFRHNSVSPTAARTTRK